MVSREYAIKAVARTFLSACRNEGGGIEERWDDFKKRVWPKINENATRMRADVWSEVIKILRKDGRNH